MLKIKIHSVAERYTPKLAEHAKAESAKAKAEHAATRERNENGRFKSQCSKSN